MATYVKGDAIANATSYELAEKNSDGTYTPLATNTDEINFQLDELGLEAGTHTLVVRAVGDGVTYENSDYSNEVAYTVAEEETPTVDTWYVDHRNNASSFTTAVNIAGRGWCHKPATPAYEAYVGKPVNAIGFFTTSTSQTVTIMKVPQNGGVDEGTIIATTTATGSGSKEFVYVTFPTVTLAENECLVAFAQDDSNIQFYYAKSSGVTDANGIVDGNFYGRVPKVYGSGTAWTSYTENICLGWSIGYVVEV
ncbi:MAG: hypothetical protein IJE92_01210 [Clostridia bacterium]|nr:hypothetical protein [Clostridia bacterium]